jgi:hypothetical protein
MFSAKENSKVNKIVVTIDKIPNKGKTDHKYFRIILYLNILRLTKLEITENWLFTICIADIHFFKILLLIGIWASSCVLPTLTLTVSEAIQQKVLRRTNAGVTFRFQSQIVAHRENFVHHLIFDLPQHTSSVQFEDSQKELNLAVKDLAMPEFLPSPLSSILSRSASHASAVSHV